MPKPKTKNDMGYLTDAYLSSPTYAGVVHIDGWDDIKHIGEEIMPAEQNEATVRTWVEEAWNRGRVESQEHIFSSNYRFAELPPQYGTGSTGLLNFVRAFREGFPDLHFEILDVVTNDNMVVWRALGSGTHKGVFMDIPPTGKHFSVQAIIMSRFEDGLWAEDHVVWDRLGMLQQLGVIPTPDEAVA